MVSAIQYDKYPFVSVIVPTYNDGQYLELCLKSLQEQSYPADKYEIIVIDNGSEISPELAAAQFDKVALLNESTPGSYVARNKGVSAAKGDVLAFIDADAIADERWIEEGVASLLSSEGVGLVGGRVKFYFKEQCKPNIFELFDSVNFFRQKDYVENEHFSVTANLFTWRAVFNDVGCFNSELKSGGDLEWGRRVYAQGYILVYAEKACIEHPARSEFGQIVRKFKRIIGGHVQGARGEGAIFVTLLRGLLCDANFFRMYNRRTKLDGIGVLENLCFLSVCLGVSLFSMSYRVALFFGQQPSRE